MKPPQNSISAKTIAGLPDGEVRLYTIGHSNMSVEEYLALLEQHRITVLVDVRSAPYSRYMPQFNKANLEGLLRQHHVDYRFAGKWLGGQPQDPGVYRDGVVPDDSTARAEFLEKVDYEAVMRQDWYRRAIDHLLAIVRDAAARDERVAIMCSESNPHECHRHHLIARSLIDPHVRVVGTPVWITHILRDGGTKEVAAADFEKVEQLRLL